MTTEGVDEKEKDGALGLGQGESWGEGVEGVQDRSWQRERQSTPSQLKG